MAKLPRSAVFDSFYFDYFLLFISFTDKASKALFSSNMIWPCKAVLVGVNAALEILQIFKLTFLKGETVMSSFCQTR